MCTIRYEIHCQLAVTTQYRKYCAITTGLLYYSSHFHSGEGVGKKNNKIQNMIRPISKHRTFKSRQKVRNSKYRKTVNALPNTGKHHVEWVPLHQSKPTHSEYNNQQNHSMT